MVVGIAMDLHGSVVLDIGIGFSKSDYCWQSQEFAQPNSCW